MLNYIEYLNVPVTVAIAIVGALLFMQLIGEFLEFKGKVVPEFMKIRKRFARKKREREEVNETLKEVKQLLSEVNSHYSADNIAQRNSWMQWVNDRAEVYDNSIVEINNKLDCVTTSLNANTKMTEESFVEGTRDRIISFATKVADEDIIVSREEFNRIFKAYTKYENFLEAHDMTNGEIDIAYRIISESYENHMRNHSFLEDVRGYTKSE